MRRVYDKVYKIFTEEAMKYIIFGILTTLINILVYYIFSHIGISYLISNSIAFIFSIIFAFVTNKFYVFKCKDIRKEVLIREIYKFILSRLGTFLIDTLLMFIGVRCLRLNDLIVKYMVNIVVIILNYIVSKKIVFKMIEE